MIGSNASRVRRRSSPCGAGGPSRAANMAMSSIIGTSSIRCAASRWRCSTWSIATKLFPRRAFALAFEALLVGLGERPACRAMVGILALAHERGCEAELALALQADLDQGVLPDLAAMIERFRPKDIAWPTVVVTLPSLAIYDQIATNIGAAA